MESNPHYLRKVLHILIKVAASIESVFNTKNVEDAGFVVRNIVLFVR